MFHQLGRQVRQSIVMAIRRAVFDYHVLALDDADLAQTLSEGIHQRWWLPKALMEKAYNRKRLLPWRQERPPRHRATKQDTKIAAIESCTMHL
jgi:hypothetical protein